MSRGYVLTGMNCYMKQYGVSENEAFRVFQKMDTESRKMMNEEFLKTADVPRRIMKTAFDCARSGCVGYNCGDGVTYPKGKITKYIISLYVNRICF